MHELGTVIYIIETVEKLAVENDLKTVESITVELGEVSAVIPEFLLDFWRFARKRSELLKETELKIETLKAVTYCEDCGKTYATMEYGKECPYCHSPNTYLLTGNEYIIKQIEGT